jgi:putative endopeptidase
VLAFESSIARSQWSEVEERDELKTYNQYMASDLVGDGFPWATYLQALGVSSQTPVIVREPSAFSAAARTWSETPLAVLKDWLLVRYLDKYATFLPPPFAAASFAFHGTALEGTLQAPRRWQRGASLVARQMGDGVGRAYVEAYFPPSAKAEIEAIVVNVKRAFRERLANEPWMSEATRQRAIEKLDSFEVVVGYPGHWRDDSGLRITPDDLAGNVARAERYAFNQQLRRLGTRVERREFDHSAALPWAWATPMLNEIGFSAAFLQPPYFDPAADPAVNYGAIGAVIGHELSHHFDDRGRRYDARGRLADWWTADDAGQFAARSKALVLQYDAYEPLPGLHVNGALTLGENLADRAGLNISYQAYIESLDGKPAPVIDGFTGPQRFFMGDAQSHRSKQRDADLRTQLLSDPHPPEKERSEEVRNIDAWYEAFHVSPGDAMYLAPGQRVRIW